MEKEILGIIGGALGIIILILFFVFKEFVKELIKKASNDIAPDKAYNMLVAILSIIVLIALVLIGRQAYSYYVTPTTVSGSANASNGTSQQGSTCQSIKDKAKTILEKCEYKLSLQKDEIKRIELNEYKDIVFEIQEKDCADLAPDSDSALDSIRIFIKPL